MIPEITDYMGSTVGNALFSGVSLAELWSCICMAKTREELDAAVSAVIRLKELGGSK